jgi:hypothetical protein
MGRNFWSFVALAVAVAITRAAASDNGRELFTKSWEGRTIVVKRTLYTLVYNERGRLGTTRRNRRAGLVVVTPFSGTYLQFDGRQSEDDIVDQDPQRLMDTVKTTYRSDALDVREYQKVEPIVLTRYEIGAELVVTGVSIERDTVRLLLNHPRSVEDGGEPSTALTVKWPTPLSKALSERDAVESLIAQFVGLQVAQ